MFIIKFFYDFLVCRNVNSSNKNIREVMYVNIRRYSKIDVVNIIIWRECWFWILGFYICVLFYYVVYKLLY